MTAFLTPKEVAARWKCHASHVRTLCASGKLRGLRIGDLWRFSEEAVSAYQAAHTTSAETVQPAAAKQEVSSFAGSGSSRVYTTVELPADYEPVFPDLWPGHVPAKKKASSVSR